MDLPIGISLPGFPVEVEGKGEVDRLGGLLDDLSENLLKNVFTRLLRPPSELPGGEGEFDWLTSLGVCLVRFFMVVRKTFFEPLEIGGCSLTVMIGTKGNEGWVPVLLAIHAA
jgi:hypothetical protein